MRFLVVGLAAAAGLGLFHAVSSPNSQSADQKPFGLAKRVPWTASRVLGFPEPPPPYRVRRAFAELSFKHPLYLIAESTAQSGSAVGKGERLLVVELEGKIHVFANDPKATKTELFLHMPEDDTYGITFHPRYAENRLVYVFSNGPRPDAKNKKRDKVERRNRIYSFEVSKVTGLCDPETKKLIIEWPSNGHNGGDLAFGPDGMLYMTSGDGTSDSDGWLTGQDLSDLASGIVRIDVDHPETPGADAAGLARRNYSIPKDNPFLKVKGARAELWAFGLRNPWRMTFDGAGRLWVGDVGQDLWEMVHLIKRGGNYGWSVMEGSQPFQLERKKGPGAFIKPVVEHHHGEARSITMGHVYQGERFKDLNGTLIYGDYSTGKVWGLRFDKEKVTWNQELANTVLQMVAFGRDRKGELYIVDYVGHLYELDANPPPEDARPFPQTLSETGLFTSVKEHRLAPGIVPYSVNAPFWTDHSYKDRYLALPGDSQIEFRENGAWNFAEGAVLVKTFYLDLEQGKPASRKRIETRLLTFQQGQWYGYSYRWNEAETEGYLVKAGGEDRHFTIKDARHADGIRKQVWHYPSRTECMVCHSRAAGFVLGLNTLQMNKVHDYTAEGAGPAADNQLRALEHAGYFRNKVGNPKGGHAKLVNPDDAGADLEARARAYLHVNCANCHVAAGGGNAAMELHWRTSLEKMNLIDAAPLHDRFGIADARLVAPGHPEKSLVLHRLTKTGRGRMPPLSSTIIDEPGVQLLTEWVRSLKKE